MRRILLSLLTAVIFAGSAFAHNAPAEKKDSTKTPFSVKALAFRGTFLDNNTHFNKFQPFHPAGVHMGLEFPSFQQRPWQEYLGNPTIGVGLSWLDFSHEMVGMAIAAYPYILLDAIDTDAINVKFKLAAGLGYVTEHWYTQEDTNPDHYYEPTVNTIFGCPINVYLNAGVNMNFPITDYLSASAEFGYYHMSNGRTNMPNIGMNAIYGSVGLTTHFNTEVKKKPVDFPDLPYNWSINITGALGAQKSAIEDPKRFLISSFHTGAVYSVNNWYGLGVGIDVFYNDAVSKKTARNLYCDGDYEIDGKLVDCTTCGAEKNVDYTLKHKVRAGIALNNEFRFGVVTAIVDWGVYFYNPSRHIYYDYHMDNYGTVAPKRDLFYESPYGAGAEEAFHYIRFGLKYRVMDNLYLHTSAKTHLHICEYVEFGLGYQIPFLKKSNRTEGKSNIFHYHKNWWK